ncbi:MAG: AAA family ATPase [Ktedonobacteraceae bacterium]|nr:AAA family ATPase [Ktedonobacteraceae bacterium]
MGKRAKQADIGSLEEMTRRAQIHPLVGREQELARLQQALLETETRVQAHSTPGAIPEPQSWVMPSRAPFYLLCGDIGIGKTRLAEEVRREVQKRDWSLLWSRSYVQERAPYQLWIDILRQVMERDLWRELEEKMSSPLIHSLVNLLPELAPLLPHEYLAAPIHQDQLWDAMLSLFLLIGKSGPVLVVLDDLQWADESSCEFLAYLCRHVVDLPFLLLATYRNSSLPVEHTLHKQLMQLKRERLVESLQLAPLTDDQMATFVAHMPDQMVQHIQYLAAGNPFFAEELVRAVETRQEEYKQEVQSQRWTLPQTINDLLEQRLGRLSKDCLSILRAAAVLGVSFSLSTICLMQAKNGGTPDREAALLLLEEAQEAEILTEQGNGTNITYHFWHPLLLHHLYDNISAARRILLHRRAGQILQELYLQNEEEGAASIVHHLLQSGGDARQIVRYAELAGLRAYKLSAYSEAARYYWQAVKYLQEHLQKQLQITAEEQLHVASLQEYLAECLRVLNRPDEAQQVYEQLLMTYCQPQPSHNAGPLYTELQALLQFHIARSWYNREKMEQTLQCCAQAEQILHTAAITGGGAWAYTYLQQSYVYWRKGFYAQASTLAQRACSLFEDMLQHQDADAELIDTLSPIKRMLVGDDVGMAHAYCHLAAILTSSGQYREALVYLNKALQVYEQHSLRRNVAIVYNDMGDIYLHLADFSQAQDFFQRGLQDAKYVGDLLLVAYIKGNSGILALRCGQLTRAEDHFKHAITLVEQCNGLLGKVLFSPYLALLLTEEGKTAQGQSILHSTLLLARRLHLVPYIGYVLITLGNMRLIQATLLAEHNDTDTNVCEKASISLLKKAKRTVERALSFDGIDAEIHLEGCLTLLEVSWLLDRNELVYEQVALLRTKSEERGLIWLLPRIERLLGTILAATNHQEQAALHFEQSLYYARRYDLQKEYGRTLHSYGKALLKRSARVNYTRGVEYLQEARQVFARCQAVRDLRLVEKLLASSSSFVEIL